MTPPTRDPIPLRALCREKGIRDAGEILLGNPDALVGHLEQDAASPSRSSAVVTVTAPPRAPSDWQAFVTRLITTCSTW